MCEDWVEENRITAYFQLCLTKQSDKTKAFLTRDYKVLKRCDAKILPSYKLCLLQSQILIDIDEEGYVFVVYEVQSPSYPHPLLYLGDDDAIKVGSFTNLTYYSSEKEVAVCT